MCEIDMIVTDIKEINSKRRLIYINYEPAFALYISEIKEYGISNETNISKNLYDELLNDIFYKRAVIRAMNLLKVKDYTKKEFLDKLKKDYYPTEAIDSALEYVEKYGYINDNRYADNFIRFKSTSKSRKQIELLLRQKGISDDIIQNSLNSFYEENEFMESELLIEQMIKKLKNNKIQTYEDKMKFVNYFYRKGFSVEIIKKCLDKVLKM